MVSTAKPDAQSQPGVTRRSVAKTAAHAAWAVPAIQVATAVPAFAAHSGGHLAVAPTAAWGPGNSGKLNIGATVTNSGAATTSGQLTITFTFPAAYVAITKAPAATTAWTPSLSTDARSLTFTRSAAGVPTTPISLPTVEITLTKPTTAPAISVTAIAPGCVDGAASVVPA